MRETLARCRALVVPLLVVLTAGCSSSEEPAAADAAVDAAASADASIALADIEVTVDYPGTKQGALVVGAFTSVPPMGPPKAFQTVAMPTFPAHVQLRDLEPGTVYVIAVLDMAPSSPTMPGAEDLQSASDPVMVNGTDVNVAMTLADP